MPRRSVALLIETSNGYGRGLLEGVIAYTKQTTGWSIHLTEQERGALPPAWLSSWGGDGIIARIETSEIAKRLQSFRVPMVDLSAARHVEGVPWADTDDMALARMAVEHFTERGFRHLAYCGDSGFAWSLSREKHFHRLTLESECQFHSYKSTPRYDPTFNWDVEKRRLANWLQKLPRPIAILGCYDFKAQQVLDVCRQLAIAIPEEIAVLGIDDDRLICELSDPPLSSIIPDTERTGYEAAKLLDQMMSGQAVSTAQPLVTKPLGIRVRASTDTLAIEDQDIAKALQIIRRRACDNLRVADILRQVPLSRRSLEHRFKRILGHTPHEEIRRIRINRIKELLTHTELSIGQIALRTGYEHNEYMAAAFKSMTGKTPTEFRQELKSTAL